MLSPFRLTRLSTRLVRRKVPPPANILDEGATFSDVHNVVLNPTTRLPYPEKELQEHLEKTSSEILRQRNMMKYGAKKKSTGAIDFSHLPIEEHVVLLFPGQGAQFVGMGKKIIEVPAAKRVFDEASEVLGYDMLKVCLEGPKQK
uniref:Malonyl-CoA:ACP transacylase (MAT) domain-containing protein n=1 Tax=Caenorhabditis japonica TaxID=281687 RepID=A0A8R1DUT4_CAEJA